MNTKNGIDYTKDTIYEAIGRPDLDLNLIAGKSIIEYKNNKYPFDEYLQDIHALDYHGFDDDMPDHFDSWISNLDTDELIVLANQFSKKLLAYVKR